MNALSADAPGFEVPLHRSLTEPILLGGAPRTVAIANGTLAAAVGLGLQLAPRSCAVDRRALIGGVGRAPGCAVHGGFRSTHQAPHAVGRLRQRP